MIQLKSTNPKMNSFVHGGVQYPVNKDDGTINIPPDAVASAVAIGFRLLSSDTGAQLTMDDIAAAIAKAQAPTSFVYMRPTNGAASLVLGGEQYNVNADGLLLIPEAHQGVAQMLGFVPTGAATAKTAPVMGISMAGSASTTSDDRKIVKPIEAGKPIEPVELSRNDKIAWLKDLGVTWKGNISNAKLDELFASEMEKALASEQPAEQAKTLIDAEPGPLANLTDEGLRQMLADKGIEVVAEADRETLLKIAAEAQEG